MKFHNKFLIGFLGFVAIVFLLGSLYKKDFRIEKEIIIHKDPGYVFEFLKILKNHDRFTVWGEKDPNKKIREFGVDGTVGYTISWESTVPELGKGEQEIKVLNESLLSYEHRFFEPQKSVYQSEFIILPREGNDTKLVWKFWGRMEFPLNLFLLLFNYEDALGEDYSTGLKNLKTLLENEK